MNFPYRADHVGSLLRPKELLEARAHPDVSPEQLHEIENRHILRVLQRQIDLGFQALTDGELRRRGFMSDFYESVEGLDHNAEIQRVWKGSGTPGGKSAGTPAGIVIEKIRQKRRLTAHETDFLREQGFLNQNRRGSIKMTLPSANQFPAIVYKRGISERAYPTYSEFLWDIVPIIRSEIQALLAEGVKYIQIDAPRYSYYIDPKWRGYIQDELGVDPETALDEAIRAENATLEGARREGVMVGIHLCRGNNRSQWYAEGGYDPIAEKLFQQLGVDVFLLEYESARAGTFEPLRFVPPDKAVVLGLVSSKEPALESRDGLARRVDQASRFVPLERLAVSPQCGFASTMEGNLLTEDQQWRKLELVVETARQVWR